MTTAIQEKLISKIKSHTLMLKDAKTFVWLRCYDGSLLGKYDLGGGNVLIIIGSFAILNFLAKVYYLLHEDAEVWSQTEVAQIQEEIDANSKLKDLVFAPRVGAPKKNERQCFIDFAMDMDFPLLQRGEQKTRKKYGEIWDQFRNKLAHLAIPGGSAVALDFSKVGVECSKILERLEEIDNRAFYFDGGTIRAYSDLIVRDMQKWVAHLIWEVEWHNPPFPQARIEETINWIEDQTGR